MTSVLWRQGLGPRVAPLGTSRGRQGHAAANPRLACPRRSLPPPSRLSPRTPLENPGSLLSLPLPLFPPLPPLRRRPSLRPNPGGSPLNLWSSTMDLVVPSEACLTVLSGSWRGRPPWCAAGSGLLRGRVASAARWHRVWGRAATAALSGACSGLGFMWWRRYCAPVGAPTRQTGNRQPGPLAVAHPCSGDTEGG